MPRWFVDIAEAPPQYVPRIRWAPEAICNYCFGAPLAQPCRRCKAPPRLDGAELAMHLGLADTRRSGGRVTGSGAKARAVR